MTLAELTKTQTTVCYIFKSDFGFISDSQSSSVLMFGTIAWSTG